MAVTIQSIQQLGPTIFRFTFSSNLSSPTFYIWVNGELETETFATTYDLTVPLGGQFQFSVFDDPDERPPMYYPPRFTLRWDGDPKATQFRVERYVDSAWVPVTVVIPDDTRVFHYDTDVLADSTVHSFRVVSIDAEGRTGIELELEGEMCRYPDEPDVALSVSGGEITVE